VLGPSTTQLFRNLSQALFDHLSPSDELILSQLDHEANISPWLQLAKWKGCTVKWWAGEAVNGDETNPQHTPGSLRKLLTPKTKFVACTHVSNVLGSIHPIRELSSLIHSTSPRALFCVDAVAFAPHREVNIEEMGVDFYAFSWYKVYGPHIATLYASASARTKLTSLGHYFHGTETLANQLGLAAASYELVAGVEGVTGWLAQQSWEEIGRHEEVLSGVLIEYLNSRPDLFTIYGEKVADRKKRVPVISFRVEGWKSEDVVKKVEEKSEIGCRWGAFYSDRCVERVLGIKEGGVVRVSLVFYNTGKSFILHCDWR
jgi:selenocysteine lyase/cysteine desulfurase